MIVAYSFVPVHNEQAGAEFELAMANRGRAVERFPGFLRFEFRRELRSPSRFVIATWWETRADMKRYLGSPEDRATHGKLSESARRSLGPAHVEVHEVIEATE